MLWFFTCLNRAIIASDTLMEAIIIKAKFWDNQATQSLNDRQRLMLNKFLDGFHGKLTSSKWALITKTSQDTAIRDIHDLVERGLLIKELARGRSTSYIINLK